MTILLIAHGSPDPRHRGAITTLAERVRAMADTEVSVGFLDHNQPSVAEALAGIRGESTEPVRAVGLLLSDGYHARVDVPQALAATADPVTDCGTLGLGDWVLPALDRSLARATDVDAATVGVVLVAAGSSRPEARDEVIALAARWQQRRAAPVAVAFATGTGPSLAEALAALDAPKATTCVVPLILAPGTMSSGVGELAAEDHLVVAECLLDDPDPIEVVSRIVDLATT